MQSHAEQTRIPTGARVVAIGWGGLLLITATLERAVGVSLELCLFRRTTSLPCPTCGGTRAVFLILEGRLGEAFLMNPLLVSLVTIAGLWVAGSFLSRRWLPVGLPRSISHGSGRWAWGSLVLAFALNWVYLVLQGN